MTLHWSSSSSECMPGLRKAPQWLCTAWFPHGFQHTLHACLDNLLLVLSCMLLHVGHLPFQCASHIVTYLADEEAEKDKNIAVQGSHQGWSQVEGCHQDEQHQAGAGHLRHRG